MNISQHVILPIKWKLGQYKPNGTIQFSTRYSLTHWFPLNTTNLILFVLPSNASDLYGRAIRQPDTGYNVFIDPLSVIPNNCTIFDSNNPVLPSKPFTYILIK